MSSDAHQKVVLSALFRRRGANGEDVRVFEELSFEQQQLLLARASLHEEEMAVLGGILPSGKWLLLTTRRLLWGAESGCEELPNAQVRGVDVDLHELAVTGQRKDQWSKLRVNSTAGMKEIEVEAGQPLSGVWNVLLNIAQQNRGRERVN